MTVGTYGYHQQCQQAFNEADDHIIRRDWHLNIHLSSRLFHCVDDMIQQMSDTAPNSFDRWVADFRPTGGDVVKTAFVSAPRLPPVTRGSLERLYFNHGVRMNPWYRYLVNFDIEAHFLPAPHINFSLIPVTTHRPRPITSYWQAIEYEVEVRSVAAQSWNGHPFLREEMEASMFESNSRLRSMFEQLRECLCYCRPEHFRPGISEQLDPANRMQEIAYGRLPDFEELAHWFRTHLQDQCERRMDAVVQQLEDDMAALATGSDAGAIAGVLQNLFVILEGVKLGNTSNSLKNGRPMTLGNNDMFFQQHFTRMIQVKRFNPAPSARWYCQDLPFQQSRTSILHLHHFVSRTTSTLFACVPDGLTQEQFPDSWRYDGANLNTIASGIEMLVALNICVVVFDKLLDSLSTTATHGDLSAQFRLRLPEIVGDAAWCDATVNIAPEMVRIVLENQRIGTTPVNREDLIEETEATLKAALEPSGQDFRHHLAAIRQAITEDLQRVFVSEYQAEPWMLANKYIGPTHDPKIPSTVFTGLATNYRDTGPLQRGGPRVVDIVNRLNHILILHWRWAGPLVYAPGESGVHDFINELGSRAMQGFEGNLADVPFVRDLIYGGPGSNERLTEHNMPRENYIAPRRPRPGEITWDHRYSTGRRSAMEAGPFTRRLESRAHGAESAEDQAADARSGSSVRGPAAR